MAAGPHCSAASDEPAANGASSAIVEASHGVSLAFITNKSCRKYSMASTGRRWRLLLHQASCRHRRRKPFRRGRKALTAPFANIMKGHVRTIAGSADLMRRRRGACGRTRREERAAPAIPHSPKLSSIVRRRCHIGQGVAQRSGFGVSHWKRSTKWPLRAPITLESAAGEGLTGIWSCNDGIRQKGSDLFWLGQQCTPPERMPGFANAFVGAVSGTKISGSWADAPYGGATGSGTLRLVVRKRAPATRRRD